MSDSVIQCCYTNASHELGKNVVSGWQTVAVSPDMPADAYQNAASYMNIHSSMQGRTKNEDGSDLNLIEIYGDGKYLYLIRTQYGLLDHSGRPNLFSHTFIFPWKTDGMMYDPNIYLTVASDNFKDNEDDALRIPTEFKRNKAMNILSELPYIGISAEELAYILRGIYAQATDRTIHEPLYIQFDGDERKIIGLIFCIYSVLPHYLVRNFSISFDNGEDNRNLNVILSKEAGKHNLFLDPHSYKDSIISQRLDAKLKRLEYVDFPVLNVEKYDPQIYMRNLEEIAKWLGDTEPYDEYSLRMAHLKYINEVDVASDAETFSNYIDDGLRADKCQSAGMDSLLASIVNKGVERNMIIDEQIEFNLTYRAYSHNSASLINAMEKYTLSVFQKMSVDNVAEKLSRMNNMLRNRFISYYSFEDVDAGGPILDKYYSDYYIDFDNLDKEAMNEVIDIIGDFENKPKTKEVIYSHIIILYKKQKLNDDREDVDSYFFDMVDKLEDDELIERFQVDTEIEVQ